MSILICVQYMFRDIQDFFQKCDVATCSRQASARFSCLDKCSLSKSLQKVAIKVVDINLKINPFMLNSCRFTIKFYMKAAKDPYLKEREETIEFTATKVNFISFLYVLLLFVCCSISLCISINLLFLNCSFKCAVLSQPEFQRQKLFII